MDNAQLGLLVGAMVAVNGSLGALMVAMVNRSNGKTTPKPYNGEERRLTDAIDAAINTHIITCPTVIRLEKAMQDGFKHLGDQIEAYRNQARL